ncbi:MAG: DUF1566 domain-containing protein [Myxococcota bacterium]
MPRLNPTRLTLALAAFAMLAGGCFSKEIPEWLEPFADAPPDSTSTVPPGESDGGVTETDIVTPEDVTDPVEDVTDPVEDVTDPVEDVTEDVTEPGADVAEDVTEPDADTPCVPECEGKICGDDGCGQTCGSCNEGEVCSADQTNCEKGCDACEAGCTAEKECVESAIQHVQGSSDSTDCNTPDTDQNLQEMYGFRGIVLITPLPTGDGGTLTFVDEGTGEQYSGIAVFAKNPDVLDWTVGEEMLFDGMHNEHMCNTEVILSAAQIQAAQSQGAPPEYTGKDVNTDELIGNFEAYEGMLINLKNPGEPIAEVFELTKDGDTEKIQISLCDGADCPSTIFVSAMLIPPTPDGEKTLPLPDGQEVSQLSLTELSGILYQVGGAYHLLPRNESDLVFQCVPHCGSCGSDGCGGDCGECSQGEECSDDGVCVPSSLEGCSLWALNACPPGMRCYVNDTTTSTFCMEESATDSSANGQACTAPTSSDGPGPCKDEAQCLMGICSTYLCEPDGLEKSMCGNCSADEFTLPFEANGITNVGLCVSAEIPGWCNPLQVDPEATSCDGQEGHICGLTKFGTGCVPEGEVEFGFPCLTDSECASGGVCRGGLCRRLCASSDTLCGMGILGEGGDPCVDLNESMGDLTCNSRCFQSWTAEDPEVWQLGACGCDCTDKECGDNGCGGVCGQCGEGDACTPDGMCVQACTPDCTNATCGDDGCGGDCGQCEFNSDCVAGYCVSDCQPLTDCPEGVCGQVGDGCDGFLDCNTCPSWESCGEMGTCVPEPCDCVKEAGCPGNEAGSCVEGATCTYQSEASCADFDASCDGLENCWVWSYADGGNGHAYALVTHGGVGWTWAQADINAKGSGGSLATLADTGEQTFVSDAFSNLLTESSPDWMFGPWLGASQDADAQTFEDGWAWITGEPWQADDADWQSGEPNDSGWFDVEGGLENCLQFALFSASEWNDSDCDAVAKRYLLERPSALEGCAQADVGLVCAESDEENAAALGQACEQVPGAPAACKAPGQCIDGSCKAVCKTFGSPSCNNCADGFELIDAEVFLGVCTQGQGCAPDCEGKTCGDDGCGDTCGSCDNWETCDDGGACVPTPCDCLDGDSCAVTFPDDCSAGTTCTYQGGPSCTQVDSGCHGMEFCHVWSLADGGNGHAYILVNQGGSGWTWSDADEDAKGRGGLLATMTSGEERGFVAEAFQDLLAEDPNYEFIGPWLGAAQDAGATALADGWSWLTGEPWDSEDAAWQALNNEPNDDDQVENGQENCLQFSGGSAYSWNDAGCNNLSQGYLLELPNENGSCTSSTEALVCAEYDDGAAAALGEPCAQEPGGPAACQQPGQCIQGTCETVCKMNGEGADCGDCSNGHTVISQELNLGICNTTCTPDCQGKTCGDDGCNGSCGTCSGSETCITGMCEPSECSCVLPGTCNMSEQLEECGMGATCTYQTQSGCGQHDASCGEQSDCFVWSYADGGNGHAYRFVSGEGANCGGGKGYLWAGAQAAAVDLGGYLATLTSAEERDFVASKFASYTGEGNPEVSWFFTGPWLGGEQTSGTNPDAEGTEAEGWHWITGEAWDLGSTYWANGEPDDQYSGEDCLAFAGESASEWDDYGCLTCLDTGFLLEIPATLDGCTEVEEGTICAPYDYEAAAPMGEPCSQEPGGDAACQKPGQCVDGICRALCTTGDNASSADCANCSDGYTAISAALDLGFCNAPPACVPDCDGSLAADDLALTSESPGCDEPPGADMMYVVKTHENNLFKLGNFVSPEDCKLQFDYEDLSTGEGGNLVVDASAGHAGVVLETGQSTSSSNSWGPWLIGTDIVVRCCGGTDTTEAGQPGVDVNNATLTIFEASQHDYDTFSLQAACGDDGCGGSCGECDGGANCVTSQCLCTTETDTTTGCHQDQVWLFDSCGTPYYITNSCGFGCENGACLDCVPECDGKACGDDGCGGNCGTCSGSENCDDGACVASCEGEQVITDQAGVDALATCSSYLGTLTFSGPNINDLSVLASMTSITDLVIIGTMVKTIGLYALQSLETLEVAHNDALETVSVTLLEEITQLVVNDSQSLTSLDFPNLVHVGEHMRLTDLAPLDTLDGFGELSNIGMDLTIRGLDSLTNLEGLTALSGVVGSFKVTECLNIENLVPVLLTSAPTAVILQNNPRMCDFTALTWVEDKLLCIDPGCTYTYFGLYNPCDGAECGEGCGDYGPCMDDGGMTALNCAGANEICQANQCVYCEPNCSAKSCGDDGCGGLCNDGTCTSGSACFDGICNALCNPGNQGCTANTCPGQMVQSGSAYACECDVQGGNCAPNTCGQAQDYITAAPFNASYALSHDASPTASNVYTHDYDPEAAGAVCEDAWSYHEGGTNGFPMGTWPEAVWSFSPADAGFYRFVFSVQDQADTPDFTPAMWMINETQSWNGCHTLSSNVTGAECARVGAVNGAHSRLIHDQHVTHTTTFAVTFPHGTGGTLNVAITYCGDSQSDCPVACGNGVVEAEESCDDGNNMSGDACSADCQVERFVDNGDGTVTDNGPPWLGGTGPAKMWAQCSQSDGLDFKNGYNPALPGCANPTTYAYCSAVSPDSPDSQDACEAYTATAPPDSASISSEVFDACARMNEGDGFAGHTNWRVPTELELARLVFCSGVKVNDEDHPKGEGPCSIQGLQESPTATPTIDGDLFPSTASGRYWSSTAGDGEPSTTASAIGFGGGTYHQDLKTSNARVRCIRDTVTCTPACTDKECGDDGCGGSCGTCGAGVVCTPKQECMDPYIDEENDDGIVIATATELMWMSCVMPAFSSYGSDTAAQSAIAATTEPITSCPAAGTNFRYCQYNTNACNGGPENYDNGAFNTSELSYGYTNQDIHETCGLLNAAAYGGVSSGWRVPTIDELQSLVPLDEQFFQEATIPQGGNGNASGPVYWSSTSQTMLTAKALDVNDGSVTEVTKQKYRLLRCVRSLAD